MYQKMRSHRQLSHDVADHIRMLIRDGQLNPGDKLPSEMDLTQLFGLSRPTVREAIRSLVAENVLAVVRGRGTYVTENPGITNDPLGLAFLADEGLRDALMEARLVIEPGVARLAAENADSEDRERIRSFVAEMEQAVDEHRVSMSIELEFHRSIAQASKNPVIMRIIPVIMDSIVRTYEDAKRTSAEHAQALAEHRVIVEAIAAGDGERAETAMRRHLEGSRRRTLDKLAAAGLTADSKKKTCRTSRGRRQSPVQLPPGQ